MPFNIVQVKISYLCEIINEIPCFCGHLKCIQHLLSFSIQFGMNQVGSVSLGENWEISGLRSSAHKRLEVFLKRI